MSTSAHCESCNAPLLGGGVLVCPACAISSAFGLDDAAPPQRHLLAGKYEIGEALGEGGFGIVYRAEQIEPIRRAVAVKVVKPGMDSADILARFDAERQALALLDHPGIAKILDAGETDEDRPYFVMELVEGKPITEHCTAGELTTDARLELFAEVCDALQHAHDQGIFHRDLKPSNLLVTESGDVKIIDFGVAKATRHVLTEATLLTGLHQFIGTPAYVSPEQAETSGRDVDARSDVYSLGAVLYELLAGKPPFETDDLSALGLGELLQHLRDKIPIAPKGHGDIARVAMRALEKSPEDRYPSARELAEDVRRALRDEPIAKPKRARRSKALAALLGVAVIAGFVLPKLGRDEPGPITIAALDQLYDDDLSAEAEALLKTAPASALETIAKQYLRSGRNTEARQALIRALEIQRERHGEGSRETLPALELLGDLIVGEYWISRGADSKYLLEAAKTARSALGDASPVTARCFARIVRDRGYHLGVNEAIFRLNAALARAQLAAASADSIDLLTSALAEARRRKEVCVKTAAQHYESYQNAKNQADAIHYLRRSAYWLASTGDTEAGMQRLEDALALERETSDVPFDTLQRNRIAEGWVAWRSRDEERAIDVFEKAIENHLLDDRLISNSRAELLHNFYRIVRDTGDPGRYWAFMDGFEDRNADALWPPENTQILLPRGSRWAYAYASTPPAIDWTTSAPLPSRGHAPFCDYSVPAACRLPWPTKNSPPTAYFRTRIAVPDPSDFDQIKIRLTRWASAAVYVNGTEVARSNLAPSARHDTLSTVPEPGGQMRAHVFTFDATKLKSGENTIAVEVHRYSRSTHLYFDLQLEARPGG